MLKIASKILIVLFSGITWPVCVQGMESLYNPDKSPKEKTEKKYSCKNSSPTHYLKETKSKEKKNASHHISADSGWDIIIDNTPKKQHLNFDSNAAENKDLPLPKSYRVLQICYESILYKWEDPTSYAALVPEDGERASIQRAKEDSLKNKNYFQASTETGILKSFSIQPRISSLKNGLGIEVQAWLAKCKNEREPYNKSLIALNERGDCQRKNPSPENLRLYKSAQQASSANFIKLVRKHGPKEVMLGERELSAEEFLHLKDRIRDEPKIRTSYDLSKGTPYFTKEGSNFPVTQALILKPDELTFAYERLQKFVKTLEREHHILMCISVYYKDTFLPKVNGWQLWQLGNMWNLSREIESAQRDIMAQIELEEPLKSKYPLPSPPGKWSRDRINDKGEVLACLNKDKRGQNVENKFLYKIREKPLLDRYDHGDNHHQDQQSFGTFSRIYMGEDELEPMNVVKECHIESKYPFTQPEKIEFKKVKTRKYLRDEERYNFRFVFQDPTENEIELIDENEVALYSKSDQSGSDRFYCKVKHKKEREIDIDDLKGRLGKAMQENKEISPLDRRLLLDFVLINEDVSRTQEVFIVPEGVQMVEEYPSLGYVIAHKKRWPKEAKEFEEQRRYIYSQANLKQSESMKHCNITNNYEDSNDFFSCVPQSQLAYQYDDLKRYNELYDHCEKLLEKLLNRIREMFQPYGNYSSIPKAWDFFISKAYEELPTFLTPPPQTIALNSALISDMDLEKKRRSKDGYSFVLYCYSDVNLSDNSLTGEKNYHFPKFITNLNLSGNLINSLKFLSQLTALKILNLSHNKLSDLNDFWKLADPSDRGCLFLQELDLSHNEIVDVTPLSSLIFLTRLDISNNKIKTLKGLYDMPVKKLSQDEMENSIQQMELNRISESFLVYLNISDNALEGSLADVFPKVFKKLETLEVRGNKELKFNQKEYYSQCEFNDYFPCVKNFERDINGFI